jgi:hypothetical protein
VGFGESAYTGYSCRSHDQVPLTRFTAGSHVDVWHASSPHSGNSFLDVVLVTQVNSK